MLKRVLLGIAALIVAAAGFMVWKIGPRNVIGIIRYDTRKEGDLKVGHRAPELMLVTLDGRTQAPLIGPRDKPLVLVFGSFT